MEDTERNCHWIAKPASNPHDAARDSIFEAKTLISTVGKPVFSVSAMSVWKRLQAPSFETGDAKTGMLSVII